VPAPFHFEEFALDLERYELRRSGEAVKLERIPMELLILLLQNNGKLVRREAINHQLWGQNAYQNTEHSVNTAVNKLRYILRDDPRDPRFIQTVVGQGYRFIAEVAAAPSPANAALPSPGTEKTEAKQLVISTASESVAAAPLPSPVKVVPAGNIEVEKPGRNVPSQPAGRSSWWYSQSLSLCWPQPPSCTCATCGLPMSQKMRWAESIRSPSCRLSTWRRAPIRTTSSMG
jgi:DNA-binding winged helix-turn-helix (wHTH) protein